METRKARATRQATPEPESTADAPDAPARRESVPLGATPQVEGAHPQGASVARVGYAPIVRVDAIRRELELCATSEALDSYGTVFDYAASKDAFTRWIGNVREMHERRAVGSRVSVRCDDEQRKVYVRVRISHGASDTWEKVLDGTLRGASIGASNVVWERQARRVAGRERLLNVATCYDLIELSLVDSPSNPDALCISIVRDAVPDATMLDDLTINPSPPAVRALPAAPAERQDGATHIVDTSHDIVGASGGRPRDDAMESVGAQPAAPAAVEVGAHLSPSNTALVSHASPLSSQGEGSGVRFPAPPEVRIARQAMAHGWAAIQAAHDSTPPAHESNRLTFAESGSERPQPPAACSISLELSTGAERSAPSSTETVRERGPFSTNLEGFPDTGVPAQAVERPTSALGVREEGNARDRFHAAARGILQGCGCPLCEGALAALGETGTAEGSAMLARRTDGAASAARESALARALAAGLTASVTRMERMDGSVRGLSDILQAAMTRIESTASDLRQRLETLEAQPRTGGPAAFAFDKSLALAPSGGALSQPGAAEQRRALESLAGKLTDPRAQIAVAAELIRLQRGE